MAETTEKTGEKKLSIATTKTLTLKWLVKRKPVFSAASHATTTGRPRPVLPWRRRGVSVRSAVAWSYDLLSEEQRNLFRQLGVFAEGNPPGVGARVHINFRLARDDLAPRDARRVLSHGWYLALPLVGEGFVTLEAATGDQAQAGSSMEWSTELAAMEVT